MPAPHLFLSFLVPSTTSLNSMLLHLFSFGITRCSLRRLPRRCCGMLCSPGSSLFLERDWAIILDPFKKCVGSSLDRLSALSSTFLFFLMRLIFPFPEGASSHASDFRPREIWDCDFGRHVVHPPFQCGLPLGGGSSFRFFLLPCSPQSLHPIVGLRRVALSYGVLSILLQ